MEKNVEETENEEFRQIMMQYGKKAYFSKKDAIRMIHQLASQIENLNFDYYSEINVSTDNKDNSLVLGVRGHKINQQTVEDNKKLIEKGKKFNKLKEENKKKKLKRSEKL